MSTRYVWNRYDDCYELTRSSLANGTVLQIVDSANREIHYTTEKVTRPRYSSVSGEFALRNVTTKNLNSGDNQDCTYFYLTDDEDNVYGDSGDSVNVRYNDSRSVSVSCSTATLYRYRTQRAADHSTPHGSVSSSSSGTYPTNGWRSPYWYEYQGHDSIDPARVSLPGNIMGGDTITASITPSSGKTYGGTVSYTYQYRLDGGAWQTLTTTTETTQSITVPKGTNTVEAQVRAQDNLGFTSSTWVSSGAITVINNLSPTAPTAIKVSTVVAAEPVTITVSPATDPDGSVSEYIIERQANGGSWTEVQRSTKLTFTETVNGSWSTVAYRAAAVDNEGAQGPYVTSSTIQVGHGSVTITGPAADQGTHSGPFDIAVTLGIDGHPQTQDVEFSVRLDGVEAIRTNQIAGDQITLRLDPRVMPRGAHTLQVSATKEDYMAAAQSYTYSIPDWDGSDIEGGWSGVIQDPTGRKLLPKTLAQDCLGPGGKDMATIVTELQAQIDALKA